MVAYCSTRASLTTGPIIVTMAHVSHAEELIVAETDWSYPMPNQPLAVQMYTLHEQVVADIVGSLRAVAELGYTAVELHTLGGKSAAELRTELDMLGLRVAGMH